MSLFLCVWQILKNRETMRKVISFYKQEAPELYNAMIGERDKVRFSFRIPRVDWRSGEGARYLLRRAYSEMFVVIGWCVVIGGREQWCTPCRASPLNLEELGR